MAVLIQALDATAATRWHRRLWGGDHDRTAKPKTHRLTKEAYYRAAVECLTASGPGSLPKWTDVVARAPNGARATFYSVAGPRANYPLHREYLDGTGQQREIANGYARVEAVAQLIDEAKVWRYWGFREGWTHEVQRHPELSPSRAATNLVSVLADWAVANKPLAIALDHAPPMCAVEDFLVIFPQRRAAAAARLLRKVVVRALSPIGTTADGVLDAVRPELEPSATSVSSDERAVLNELVGRLAEALDALGHELRTLPPDEVAVTREFVVELMRDAIEDFGTGEGNKGGPPAW